MSQQPFGDTQPFGAGADQDRGDYLEFGGEPRPPRRPRRPGGQRHLLSIPVVALAALLGGAGLAYAVGGSGSSPRTVAANPGASPSANPARPPHLQCARTGGHCPGIGFGPFGRIPFGIFGGAIGGGLPGGLVHGQIVVMNPAGGGYQTVDIQSGKVTAVSSTSITLKSADGYSASYAISGSTIVDAQRDGIGSVKVGNEISLEATGSGSKATASSITDLSLIGPARNHAFPFGYSGADPGGASPGGASGGTSTS